MMSRDQTYKDQMLKCSLCHSTAKMYGDDIQDLLN